MATDTQAMHSWRYNAMGSVLHTQCCTCRRSKFDAYKTRRHLGSGDDAGQLVFVFGCAAIDQVVNGEGVPDALVIAADGTLMRSTITAVMMTSPVQSNIS